MDETGTILLVDDDAVFRQTVCRALQRRGFAVLEAENGERALSAGGLAECNAALIDLRMPGMDGLELLKRLREQYDDLPVIVLTGHGSIATAIDAIKLGAFHYLTKPCDIPEVEIYLGKAIQQHRIERENRYLRSAMERAHTSCGLIGHTPVIQNILTLIERMRDADAPVLISGESGTGKELVAQALHYQGKRKEYPFIAINCATLKPELLENELFGHVSGAFTGAVKRKEGLFAAADGGTLFIDEIADMNPGVQASLLRVIETGVFRPLGSTREQRTNVRILAAVNRDLAGEVAAGRFRQDLFFRLSVLVIQIPPLRERIADIPLLVEEYLRRTHAFQKGFRFDPDAVRILQTYSWPGNVRELFNICERAILLSNETTISPATVQSLLATGTILHTAPPASLSPSEDYESIALDDMEKTHIKRTLERTGFNVSQTADLLKIDRRTLQRKMMKYGLRES